MEIYNEEINDLLSLENQKLPIHESLERGMYVAGLSEEIVNSAEQVLDLIKLGEENRHFGETNMNARSSRSHTIFRMVIESTAKDTASSNNASNVDAIRVSNLVDLAESERIAKTGDGGVRLKEGKYINKSLMILGNVINKLSESEKQRGHILYRDSKLTRILQPALGGNAKTSIICTLAPEEVHTEETKGTVLFASRAKRITNCAQVNEVNAANECMLGGGGVDGAIHRVAGPELRAACYEVPEMSPGVRCPTGEDRITPAFRLPVFPCLE